jgi:uncharacterized phage protein (TIGR01671 family)
MEYRYLFKAKRIDNGEWVQGYLYGILEKKYILWGMTNDIPNMIEVDPTTICQCTGLKDKNGKLIWENDIASYSDLITGDKKIICIEWNKMQASFVRKYRSPMGLQYIYIDEYIASRMEIIGNIFDNPELLESEG